MTKREAAAEMDALRRAGWPVVRVEQNRDGSWSAVGQVSTFRIGLRAEQGRANG